MWTLIISELKISQKIMDAVHTFYRTELTLRKSSNPEYGAGWFWPDFGTMALPGVVCIAQRTHGTILGCIHCQSETETVR